MYIKLILRSAPAEHMRAAGADHPVVIIAQCCDSPTPRCAEGIGMDGLAGDAAYLMLR